MTKKDYVLIGKALKYAKPLTGEKYEQWFATVSHMQLALEDDNPKFDRNKFLTACGIDNFESVVEVGGFAAATLHDNQNY